MHTLMKATPGGTGLEEHFIIPIARELAIALKYVHEAGVIHRDVKCKVHDYTALEMSNVIRWQYLDF